MTRILIADDHQLVIDGIKLMLSTEPDLECAGEANDGNRALDMLPELQPDLVILDINMPGLNGIEACRKIRESHPNLRVLILSMLREVSLIKLVLKNGADGYLLKSAGRAEILDAIRKVRDGEKYFSPEVSALVMESLSGARPKASENPFPKLSRREKQVLRMIVDEYTTTEIAEKLFISFGTVETHRRNLLIKLGARNTAGLVRACFEYELLDS
ncbi:MAG TPA: response regulator transcription factor [Flavilitoribacter sp.]|nr:response regulator transcription factor [Flavilitoribacter sp.]HMQ87344.1 response regulator transcription factor [Flavilitoribacter sp.]